ncbi:uncharacterized protein H6S33_000286 [Morchella sextelata]|uniref:uncharacterized protein n=1 Tax=Morchella sextelata TaxID=1174677 RepID=UPI001D054F3E|nr:uncharacterized protein H6S33_000286 [Morchella sextelata]KAH0614650.1 hypothetical protein H6S33_000286 [Morchella sextelata]
MNNFNIPSYIRPHNQPNKRRRLENKPCDVVPLLETEIPHVYGIGDMVLEYTGADIELNYDEAPVLGLTFTIEGERKQKICWKRSCVQSGVYRCVDCDEKYQRLCDVQLTS